MNLPPPITSRTNARVKALRAAFSGKASQPGELLGIEGPTMIVDAARSGIAFETVFVRQGSEAALHGTVLKDVLAREFVTLSADAFDSAVDTASPQGVAATLSLPVRPVLEICGDAGTFLFLENLQDPGNMGTLLRSAEAFGVRQVIATTSSVNAWNPKTIRASAGSVFRVQVVVCTMQEFARNMMAAGIKLIAAIAQSENAVSLMEANLIQSCVLMIGNEGAGLSAEAVSIAHERVHIPCAIESLNAAIAGSVLMYEAARQNAPSHRARQ